MPGRKTQRLHLLVLERTKLGEQDLILTTLGVTGEQVRVVAKGARKPGSKLAARTELFCDVDVLVSQGRGMGIVTEAQIMDAHGGLRGDFDRIAAASAMCEIARLACYEDVEDAFLHPLLSRALLAVEQSESRAHMELCVAAYSFKVLSHGGWRPVLDACVACGEEPATRFSVLAGGVLCESCARELEGALPILPEEVAWLQALIGSTFDVLLATEVPVSFSSRLLGLAHAWASTHLDARLRAMEFFSSAVL